MNTGVPPPESGAPPDWAGDSNAEAEEKHWGNEEKLLDAKTWADILWARAYGAVMIAILVVFAILFLGSLVSWSLHYILPNKYLWLSVEQLSKIQSVVFSGSLGGMVSLIAQKQLMK